MADPRAENCKGYKLSDDGRVTGVLLDYHPDPAAIYELKTVSLVDEIATGSGQTVASVSVLNKDGLAVGAKVFLAWPYTGGWDFEYRQLPGNSNQPIQHIITNGYDAARGDRGPLAIYIGDNNRQPVSDLIAGLGLPNKRHVSYLLTFRERGASVVEPGPGTSTVDLTAVIARLDRIEARQLEEQARWAKVFK